MNKPLKGLRVIDLTHMLAGPYGAMILADLGAETIKVEPLHGEGTRKLLATDPNNSLEGMGAYYLTLNRNKQSICIDLKTERGLELFYELVKEADIVINNFGAGVPAKLKIDYDSLANVNERIITCSVTGFGSNGPTFKRPAFDQISQATGGGMSITDSHKDNQGRAGIPIGDLGGGMFAATGILAAVVERATSGKGQDVDVSMLDCQISMLNYMATMYFLSGNDPHPIGNSHFVHVPYDSYATADGYMVIAVITDNFWTNLKKVTPSEVFNNPEYDTQPARLRDKEIIDTELQKILKDKPTAHWIEQLNEQRVPCAPVNKLSEALVDEQVVYRNMVIDLKHPNGASTKGPGNPIKLSRTNEESFSPAPTLGQNTDDVLANVLGYSDEQIRELRSQKVINE